MAPSDEAEREVEHAEIGVGPLLPADQDAAEAVEPGMGALHNPAACFATSFPFGRDLLAAGAQMKREAELLGQRPRLVIVIALIKAEPLRLFGRGCWPLDRDRIQRRPHQLVVVPVGTS